MSVSSLDLSRQGDVQNRVVIHGGLGEALETGRHGANLMSPINSKLLFGVSSVA